MGLKFFAISALLSLIQPMGGIKTKASCAYQAHSQIKIAIIDTGLDITDQRFAGHICKEGHYNFVSDTSNTKDFHGHGTHVAGLIEKYAGKGNYCFLIYKYYSDDNPGAVNLRNEIYSLESAIEHGATIINFSGGGPEFSEDEYLTIRDAKNVTFVVAAGNEHENIDEIENYYYPASYRLPNVIVVGNVDELGNRAYTSNYGKRVTAKEVGVNVRSFLPDGEEGYMTGTSQATAIHTGKIVREKLSQCDRGF